MFRRMFSIFVFLSSAFVGNGQSSRGTFDATSKVFRLDGGDVTYAFGVNARGELQQLYWGGRLGAADRIPGAVAAREWASFDSSYTNTAQEYAGWGSGLFAEPALKVTFADGNRDLVLHYDRHEATSDGFNVVLKDIKRQVFVTLHYSIDAGSGILARSATIENREAQPVTIEQAAAAAWALPAAALHAQLSDGTLGRRMDPDPGASPAGRTRD